MVINRYQGSLPVITVNDVWLEIYKGNISKTALEKMQNVLRHQNDRKYRFV